MTAFDYAGTAIRRNKPSAPLKKFLLHLPKLKRLIGHIVIHPRFFDYGCGRGDDVKYLINEGYDAVGFDPHFAGPDLEKIHRHSGNFNVVTLFYVLNILPTPMNRRMILTQIRCHLGSYGIVAVATRSPAEIERATKDTWVKYGDGWRTPSNTFQRGFSPGEVSKMLMKAGWGVTIRLSESNFTLVVGLDSMTVLDV